MHGIALVPLSRFLKRNFREWKAWELLKNVWNPLPRYTVLWLQKKRNNKLRVCMDSTVLSCMNIFLVETVKDVITRMPNVKVFSVLDANHGFWQVKPRTVAS